MVNVFLGILLQAFPFLLIGVLLSSAIQIFVSQQWLHEHFPKHLAGSLFCSRPWPAFVCPCATAPQFRCSEAWFGRASPCCRRYLSDGRAGHQSGGHSQHLVCFQRGCQNRPVPGGARLAVCGADRTYLFQSRKERLEPVRLRLVFLGLRLVLWVRQQRAESSPSISAIRKRSFSVLGSTLCWAPWYPPCSSPWTGHFRGERRDGLFLPLLVLMGMAFFSLFAPPPTRWLPGGFAGQFPWGP